MSGSANPLYAYLGSSLVHCGIELVHCGIEFRYKLISGRETLDPHIEGLHDAIRTIHAVRFLPFIYPLAAIGIALWVWWRLKSAETFDLLHVLI